MTTLFSHDSRRAATALALSGLRFGIALTESALAMMRSFQDSLQPAERSASEAQAQPAETQPVAASPAVPIEESVTPEHVICLEDGRAFKTLKRHLRTAHGLAPAEYRARWGLSADHPLVAPGYASERSAVARRIGLGGKHPRRGGRKSRQTAKKAA